MSHGPTIDRRDNGAADVVFLQLPSPPGHDVLRDYAGGFGVALPSARTEYGHGETTQPYLSLVYAFSGALAAGVTARFLDAQAEHLGVDALMQRLASMRPKLVVSVVNLPSLSSDLALLDRVHDVTGARIAVGGTVARVLPEDVLASDAVDAAVIGDLEVVWPGVVDWGLGGRELRAVEGVAYNDRGRLLATDGGRMESLDVLPVPAFGALPMAGYRTWEFGRAGRLFGKEVGGWPPYFTLYLSRGCQFGCDYCPYPLGFGRRHLIKPLEQSLEEFALCAQHGAKYVIMRDQVPPTEHGHFEEFCKRMVKADLGLGWCIEARLGSLDDAMLKLMRSAGCVRIHYGVETGDPDTFTHEAKRGVKLKSIRESLDATEAAGIVPGAHFLIGFPEDSWKTVASTAELIRECGIANGDCSIMTPYPGTSQFEEARAAGRLSTERWDDYTGMNPILQLDHLSPVELLLARSYILRVLESNSRRGLRERFRELRAAVRSERRSDEVVSLVERFVRPVPFPSRSVTPSVGVDAKEA